MLVKQFLLTAAALLALACSTQANAGLTRIDLSAGEQWRTTTDAELGAQWATGNLNTGEGVAAFAPYGNSGTNFLDPNKMMWNCGADGSLCREGGIVSGGSGPTEAFFGLSFFIKPGAGASDATISIIADDFFDLVVNGHEILFGLLDAHLTPDTGNGLPTDKQPIPLAVNIAPFLRTGNNVLAVRAIDGFLQDGGSCSAGFTEVSTNAGAFCKGNRGNEYLYISGVANVVPAPGTLALIGAGMLALALRGRKAA